MMIRGYCVGCDSPLRGKQRKWCSEACRKRTERASANRPGLTGNVRELGEFVRKSSANVRKPSGFGVTISVVIEYDHNGWDANYDGWRLKSEFGRRLNKLIEDAMEVVNHRWTYEVSHSEVRHHRPEPFKWDDGE